MNSLKPRLLTAAVGIPAVVVIMILTELWHPLVAIMVGLVNVVIVMEYLNARRLTSCLPLTVICGLFALFVPMLILTPYWYLIATLFVMASSFVLIKLHKKLHFSAFTYAISGTVLITFGMSAFPLAVNHTVSSSFFFVMLLLLPWMADGGGYFIGSALGKHKLCPDISPKKTIEGVIGGFVFCLIAALVMGLVFQVFIIRDCRVNFVALVIMAFLVSAASVLGDVFFSLIKRQLNIKDYGTIFPGHGGVLDRFDSIIFTAPLILAVQSVIPFFIAV